jgi:hypothetical protein
MKSVSITKKLLAQAEVEYAKQNRMDNLIFLAGLGQRDCALQHLNAIGQMRENDYR